MYAHAPRFGFVEDVLDEVLFDCRQWPDVVRGGDDEPGLGWRESLANSSQLIGDDSCDIVDSFELTAQMCADSSRGAVHPGCWTTPIPLSGCELLPPVRLVDVLLLLVLLERLSTHHVQSPLETRFFSFAFGKYSLLHGSNERPN